MEVRFTDIDHGKAAFATRDIIAGDTTFLMEATNDTSQAGRKEQDGDHHHQRCCPTKVIGGERSSFHGRSSKWDNAAFRDHEPPLLCVQSFDSLRRSQISLCPCCLSPPVSLTDEIKRWKSMLSKENSTDASAFNTEMIQRTVEDNLMLSPQEKQVSTHAAKEKRLKGFGFHVEGEDDSTTTSTGVEAASLPVPLDPTFYVSSSETPASGESAPSWFCCEGCRAALDVCSPEFTEEDAAALLQMTDGEVQQMFPFPTALEIKQGVHNDLVDFYPPTVCIQYLHRLATVYDEKMWFVFLAIRAIVMECARGHGSNSGISVEQQGSLASSKVTGETVRDAIAEFNEGYDEGRMPLPSDEQRALLRFAHRLMRRVVDAYLLVINKNSSGSPSSDDVADDGEEEEPAASLTAQDVFQLHCALDSNVHEVIVVSPLWAWMRAVQQQQTEDESILTTTSGGGDLESVLTLLSDVSRRIDVKELHFYGMALFRVGSKFNHSCVPNAEFLPATAPCRGVVRALCPISKGEEIRISYLSLNAGSGGANTGSDGDLKVATPASPTGKDGGKEALTHDVDNDMTEGGVGADLSLQQLLQHTGLRKARLRRCYGFDCDCPLCAEWGGTSQ